MKRGTNDKARNGGHITVETAGTFVLFILFVVSILSLVNIVTLQTRMHYAITQAAQTVSIYAYGLEVIGAADKLIEADEKAGRVRREADGLKDDIGGVIEGISNLSIKKVPAHAGAAGERLLGWGESLFDDPKESVSVFLNYAASEAGSHLFGQLIRPLIGRYLFNGYMRHDAGLPKEYAFGSILHGNKSGDEYLRSMNVIDGLDGLDFGAFSILDLDSRGAGSALVDADKNVRIVVHYKVEYRFGALPLPFRPVLDITQTVVTKAWLGGSGNGYNFK